MGSWEAEQNNQTVRVVFAADSTFTMDTGQFVGEGRYVIQDSELVLEPEGALATAIPGGFKGTLEDWTRMSLCAPSGLCTEFQKVE